MREWTWTGPEHSPIGGPEYRLRRAGVWAGSVWTEEIANAIVDALNEKERWDAAVRVAKAVCEACSHLAHGHWGSPKGCDYIVDGGMRCGCPIRASTIRKREEARR